MQAGIVQDQNKPGAICRNFVGHRVEKGLENLLIVVRHDQADELTVLWVERSNDVLPDVPPIVRLGRVRTSFDSKLSWAGISFETRFIPKEHFHAGVREKIEQFIGKDLALLFPAVLVWRLWHGPGNA